MLLHQLENAARMLERHVAYGVAVRTDLVFPRAAVVRPLVFIVAREQTFIEGISFPDEIRRVRVVAYVLGMDFVIGKKVIHNAGQEGDVASGPNGCVVIRNSSRSVEAWIDHHQLGTAMVLCLSYPFKSARVSLCCISTHNPDRSE